MLINVSSCVLVGEHNSLYWETRVRVAIGAARAIIAFLHDLEIPVIHRDIKSSHSFRWRKFAKFFSCSVFFSKLFS